MGPPGRVCVFWVEGRLVLVRVVRPGLRGRVVGARAECVGEDDAVRARGFLYIVLCVSFRPGPSGWRLVSWYMLVLVRAVCPGLCGRGVGARAERRGECDAVRVRGFFYIFLSVLLDYILPTIYNPKHLQIDSQNKAKNLTICKKSATKSSLGSRACKKEVHSVKIKLPSTF